MRKIGKERRRDGRNDGGREVEEGTEGQKKTGRDRGKMTTV